LRRLTQVNVSAGEGPFADLALDAAPQQKHTAGVDHETSGDQLRAGEIDETTAAANLKPFMIRQYGSHPHLTPAQPTKANVMRELMLNVMVRLHRGIVVRFHCRFHHRCTPSSTSKSRPRKVGREILRLAHAYGMGGSG